MGETPTGVKASSVKWKKDLKNVKIPGTPARGKIHGEAFVSKSVILENGILTIRDGDEFFPDHAVLVFLFLKKWEPLFALV